MPAHVFARIALEALCAVAITDGLAVAREAEGDLLRVLGTTARIRRVALAAAVRGPPNRPHIARRSANTSKSVVACLFGRVQDA